MTFICVRSRRLAIVAVLLMFSLLAAVVPTFHSFAEAPATPVSDVSPLTPTAEVVESPTPTLEIPEDDSDPDAEQTEDLNELSTDNVASPLERSSSSMATSNGGTTFICDSGLQNISPNSQVTIGCFITYPNVPHHTSRTIRPSLVGSGGYQAELNMFASQGGSYLAVLPMQSSSSPLDVVPDQSMTFYLEIRVQSGSTAGPFDYSFTTCLIDVWTNHCIDQTEATARITLNQAPAEITLQEGTHYSFDCTPLTADVVEMGNTAQSTCTVAGLAGLNGATIQLSRIRWSITNGNGWQVSLAGLALGGASGTYVPGTLPTIGQGNSHSFVVSLTPVACSAANAPVQLTLGVDLTPVGQTSGSSASNSKTVSVSFAPQFSAGAKITQAPEAVSVDYSMTSAHTRNTSFKVQYTVSGCDGWTGSAQMSPFVNTADQSMTTVPVLSSANSGGVSIISGGGNPVVSPAGFTTIGVNPTTLIAGTATGNQVVVEQTVHVRYTVPGNTPAGTYQSTITVSTTAAP